MRLTVIIIGVLSWVILMNGQVPLDPDPIWFYGCSSPRDNAFGDIDNDGYLDLAVVREGEINYIFKNINGQLESSPSWISTDADVSIGCAFGDVDNDGDLDMAVGNYQLAGGRVKLYENEDGVMNPTPVWTASADGACWIGWGDVDGDGDLDLAAVDIYRYPCVFYNDNGTLETVPSWRAADHNIDFCGAWFDVDNDGDLDLAVGNINGSIPLLRIYENTDGTLENSASWSSILPNSTLQAAHGIAIGDINNDGWLDCAVSEDMNDAKSNYAFMNLGGQLETTPSWISTDLYRSIRCVLGDVDGDGDLDLACASGPNYYATVYLNSNDSLAPSPNWYSNVQTEWGVSFGDVDNDGVIQSTDTLYGNDTLKLFYLPHYPIHQLDSIKVDGAPIPISDYCYNRESGWFLLKNAPATGSTIAVYYYYSIDMELAAGGAYLFQNTNIGVEEKNTILALNELGLNIYPNPAVNSVYISYSIPGSDHVTLHIYDVSGSMVMTLTDSYQTDGLHCVTWNLRDDTGRRIPNGIYYAHLKSGDLIGSVKVIIAR